MGEKGKKRGKRRGIEGTDLQSMTLSATASEEKPPKIT